MSAKVFKFRLLDPVENASEIDRQMRAARAYRNDLIAIERGRRAAVRAALVDVAPNLGAIEASVTSAVARVDVATAALREARLRARNRRDAPEQRAALADARAQLKEAREALRGARAAILASDAYRAACDEINARSKDLIKGARAMSEAFWGTRGEHDQAMDATRAMPLFDGEAPNDPSFIPRTADGFVAVQLVTLSDAEPLRASGLFYGSNTSVQIDPVPTWSRSEFNRRGQPRPKLPLLRLRIGSMPDRSPIWGVWPIIQHRAIPPDGAIKRVRVVLRHIGPRPEWHVCFTVALPDETRPPLGHGACGVNFGWRRVDGGVRVATWADDTGATGTIVVPDALISGVRKADDLESVRDRSFNEQRATLAAWIKEHATQLPAWFIEGTATIALWKGKERLTRWIERWRAHAAIQSICDGADAMLASCEAWAKQDLHLWRWSSSQRRNCERRRTDIYRVAAARLAERYDTIYVDDADFAELARRPDMGAEEANIHQREAGSSVRQIVAPGELRNAIECGAPTRGARVIRVAPDRITMQCHACSAIETFDAAAFISHTCIACGAAWDQDVNAARNVLARGSASASARATTGPKGRRAKMAAALDAKRERMARAPT